MLMRCANVATPTETAVRLANCWRACPNVGTRCANVGVLCANVGMRRWNVALIVQTLPSITERCCRSCKCCRDRQTLLSIVQTPAPIALTLQWIGHLERSIAPSSAPISFHCVPPERKKRLLRERQCLSTRCRRRKCAPANRFISSTPASYEILRIITRRNRSLPSRGQSCAGARRHDAIRVVYEGHRRRAH